MKSHKAQPLTEQKYKTGLVLTAGNRAYLDIKFRDHLNRIMDENPNTGYSEIIKTVFVAACESGIEIVPESYIVQSVTGNRPDRKGGK